MRGLLFAATFVLLALPLKSEGAEHWIRLATPHFEMYTTNGEKQATAALQVFEQTRYFFLQSSNSKTAATVPVRIIAFRSAKEFKPYHLNESSFAYYLRSPKADYIVMQDISPEHYQAIMHEYTHLIIEHHDLKPPLWLNEGMAELYSSLESKGNQAVVGRPLGNSVLLLRTQPWLDLATLFAVDHDSPYYNESNKMSIFYAQSWALTHMLELGKSYRTKFPSFLLQVSSGGTVPDCLQSIYGKTPVDVIRDLHAYVNQSTLQAAVFDIKLGKSDLDPDVSEPSELGVDLTLADLLASQPRTRSEADERLSQLAQAHPESAEIQESLGYLAWNENDAEKTKQCFKLAMDRGSKNPEMLVLYSQLMLQSGAPVSQVLPILESAVSIKPDLEQGWYNLGIASTEAGQYGHALNAFAHIKSVAPAQAYGLFSAQAFCYMRMKALTQARDAASKAKTYAANPDQIARASHLLSEIETIEHPATIESPSKPPSQDVVEDLSAEPERPTLRHMPKRDLPRDEPSIHYSEDLQHVEAITKSLDCRSANRRLHVIVDSKELVLEFDDPAKVIVRNAAGGFVDLQCGPQKPVSIGIFYIPSKQSSAVGGAIRELVF